MDFVERGDITIRSGVDYWGVFSFDLVRGLPSGDSLQSCTVKSYLEAVESTDYLIEVGSPAINDSTVSLRLQYPGDTRKGNHRLVFDATCVSGARYPFQFDYVVVE